MPSANSRRARCGPPSHRRCGRRSARARPRERGRGRRRRRLAPGRSPRGGDRRQALGRGGKHRNPRLGIREERHRRVEVKAPGDDAGQRLLREPALDTQLPVARLADDPAVALGAHGPRAHEHRVDRKAQRVEELAVGLAADRTGTACRLARPSIVLTMFRITRTRPCASAGAPRTPSPLRARRRSDARRVASDGRRSQAPRRTAREHRCSTCSSRHPNRGLAHASMPTKRTTIDNTTAR